MENSNSAPEAAKETKMDWTFAWMIYVGLDRAEAARVHVVMVPTIRRRKRRGL